MIDTTLLSAWPPRSLSPTRTILRVLMWLVLMLVLASAFLVTYEWLGAGPIGQSIWVEALLSLLAGVLATVIMARREGRTLAQVGLGRRQLPRDSAMGVTIGAAELGFVLLLLVLVGSVRYAPDSGSLAGYGAALLNSFTFFAIAAAEEEVIFRGYPFLVLLAGFGAAPAVLITSVMFALAHAGNPNIGALAYLNLFLAGVLFAIALLRTLSLWYATALHLGWNWALATLADLPVSGLERFDTPLYEPVVTGPDWLTGGAFGPEAGVLGTVSIGLATAAVMWDTRRRNTATSIALHG